MLPRIRRVIARLTVIAAAAAVLLGTLSILLGVDISRADFPGLFQFLLAMVFVSLLDVLLPHGDTVDVDAALIVAALFLFGLAPTAAIVLLSRVVAHVLRRGVRKPRELAFGLLKRLTALFSASWLLTLLRLENVHAELYAQMIGVGGAFIAVQLVVGQLDTLARTGDSLLRILKGNIAVQGPILLASASIGVLAVLVHDGMGVWGLIVVLFLIAAMRQSFALLLEVRTAYRTTVETLIGAMEIQSPEEEGLGEQTASLARNAGAEFGWFGRRLELLGYSALLFHFGLSFVRRNDDSDELVLTPLAAVEFLRPAKDVVGVLRGEVDPLKVSGASLVAAYLVSQSFGHVQGYQLAVTSRIAEVLGSVATRRADRAFERAVAKEGMR